MKTEAFDNILRRTLQHGQDSRADRREIVEALASQELDAATRSLLLSRVFAIAKEATEEQADKELINWIEEIVHAFRSQETTPSAEAYFSPGEACAQHIIAMIKDAQHSIDVCVFTITDDRISSALFEAHKQRVKIRIVTDNTKAYDDGSDILFLGRSGVPVRVDASSLHMHHKFAIFDRAQLLTGSYNWTRAATNNQENIIVSHEATLVTEFQREFTRLWDAFAKSEMKKEQ